MKNENKKILFIEDDPILVKNVSEILEEEGFIVKTESDGERGLSAAFEWLPDLILCDISIPLKNGYEVLKELVESDKVRSIPFIFLTAKVERDDIRRGMQLGADDYIFKPFDLDDLLNSINLRLQKLHHNVENHTPQNEIKIYELTDKIMLKLGTKLNICTIKDLKYLKAKNPYVLLKFHNGKHFLQRQTLDEWEVKLPSKHFVRIHRSTIINLDFITKIEKLSKTSYIIQLKDEDEPFIVSKRFSAKIKGALI